MAYGRVQRPEFRSRVSEVAAELKLAGFAEDHPDGAVFIVVEGPPGLTEAFFTKVCEARWPARVDRLVRAEAVPEGLRPPFVVRS